MAQGSFSLPILPSLDRQLPHSHKMAAVAQALSPNRALSGGRKRLYLLDNFLSKSGNLPQKFAQYTSLYFSLARIGSQTNSQTNPWKREWAYQTSHDLPQKPSYYGCVTNDRKIWWHKDITYYSNGCCVKNLDRVQEGQPGSASGCLGPLKGWGLESSEGSFTLLSGGDASCWLEASVFLHM